VLGASSGFGAAIALALAKRGHPILGAHLDLRATQPRAEAVRSAIEAMGVPVRFHNANAADPRRRAEALDLLAEADPQARVGVLVHSLAFGSLRPFVGEPQARITPRQLDMTLEVMAHSLVYWVQDLLDRGLLAEGARVFALTSSGSLAALPAYGAVSAAKAALEAHVRQLAVELAPRGITVNAIMAGLARTPALEQIPGWERLAATASARNPHGRLTTPDDVANCLVALCSPDTSWMTGNVIRVDGGETITA
jgi:enoyl-[acyl-carrier protein] reductase III